MWLLPVLSFVSAVAGRVYYRLAIAGEPVPKTGPVLLVANHPNSLIDPMLVGAAAARPVRFLAKAPLFSDPKSRWMVRAAGAIPVYRRVDDPTQASRNQDMFRAVYDELSRGAAIGIFPEGLSHSEPSLAPLKTGAARIALGTFAVTQHPFPIVPIGLVFRRKDAFRSEALIVRGRAIEWEDLAPRGLDDAGAVRELTTRIDDGMRRVTVNLERWEDQPLVDCAEEVWAAHWGATDSPPERIRRLDTITRILADLRRQHGVQPPDDTPGARNVVKDVRDHYRRLSRLGLAPADLRADVRVQAAVRWGWRRAYLLGVPAALAAAVGYLLFAPPYQITGRVTKMFNADVDQRSTYQLLCGIVIYSAWIVALSSIAGLTGGWGWFFVTLAGLPTVGLIGLWIRERWRGVWYDARRFLLLRTRQQLIQQLADRQQHLAEALRSVYDRWMRSGDGATERGASP